MQPQDNPVATRRKPGDNPKQELKNVEKAIRREQKRQQDKPTQLRVTQQQLRNESATTYKDLKQNKTNIIINC